MITNTNLLENLSIPVCPEVTCIQDVADRIVGLKRGLLNSELDPKKKYKNISLTIGNLHEELISNYKINSYEIIHIQNKIFIDLGEYKIKLFQNSNSIVMCIINNRGIPIQLHEIEFSTPCKNFYSMEKLIEEIVRIIRCNYNIKCYYELFTLKEKLIQAGFNPEFQNDKLFVTILRNGINVRLHLFYSYKSIGNRGINWGDPELPCCLKAIISNVELSNIRNVLELNFTGMTLKNFNNLKKFLVIFPKYKFNSNSNSNSNSNTNSNSSNHPIVKPSNLDLDLDKKFCCNSCDYKTDVKITFTNHILSKHSTPEQRQKQYPYYCAKCDIGSMSPSIFKNHCVTPSHLKNIK